MIRITKDAASKRCSSCGRMRRISPCSLARAIFGGYRSFRRNGRSVRYEFANCRRGRRSPPSSTVVVVVVAKIKSARLRSLQAVWGRSTRGDDRESHIAARIPSSFPFEKEAQRANPFALIAWLSVDRNVSNIDRVYATNVCIKFKICWLLYTTAWLIFLDNTCNKTLFLHSTTINLGDIFLYFFFVLLIV